jgi:membrane protein YqaA with SNARE-associated domain
MTNVFSRSVDHLMVLAKRPTARRYLALVSFAESSFFPLPPDLMLVPMVAARPKQAWQLASLTTATSVAGGLFGFLLGALALDFVTPLLHESGHWAAYLRAQAWFGVWGVWAVLIAGFSPIPYKIFTLAAGAMSVSLPGFVIASIVGRGARFFLLAGLMAWGRPRIKLDLRRYIDPMGWALVAGTIAYAALRVAR